MKKMPDNLKFKIFSLVIAIFLWYYVIGSVNPLTERDFHNIPVSYKNMDSLFEKNLTIVGDKDVTVSVRLKGKTNNFLNVKASDIRAEVDMSGYNDDSQYIPIKFAVPDGLAIIDRSMTSVPIKIEKVVDKQIPVEISKEGKPEDDLMVAVNAVIPETIVVKGPSSLVEIADRAISEVNVSDITSESTRNVPIVVVNSGGEPIKGLEVSMDYANISFSVSKIKKVPIELVTEGALDTGVIELTRNLSATEIGVYGSKEVMENLRAIKTLPFDLGQVLTDGDYDTTLDLPEGVKLANEVAKIKVRFILDKISTKNLTLKPDKVELRKVPQGLKAQLKGTVEQIDLIINGLESKINPITADAIKPYLLLADLEAGEHDVKLQFDNLNGITISGVNPESLKVEITANEKVPMGVE